MNHPHPGLLANYNSLTDKHLAGYFSNTRIRRHLRRSGLISRSGRIISEKEYQLNAMRKDHHKYIRECLAQAIFHKVLEMERHHQGELKRKIETSARKDRIQRAKVERSRRAVEDGTHLLSPHPPTGPRNRLGRRRFGNRGYLGQLATYPRPSTAPGSIQQPVRLQPLLSCATDEPAPKAASRPKPLVFEKEQQYASGGEKGVLKSLDYSAGISPYRLPVVNNFVVPTPPPPRSDKKSGTLRGRRFRPTTAPNGLDQMMKETVKFYRPQIQSNASVTMIYLGKTVHLSYDLLDNREEIKIYQQHCGGENLCVFRDKVLEGETFQFVSKRHYGFPFSLTFYLNGMQVDRLSTCCEYKHRKGTRLGGKHGYFGLVNVERSAPCYRCIIKLGLDKKPFPPKKKTTVADEEKKEDSVKEEYSYKLPGSSSSGEESKYLRFTPATKQQKEFVGDAQEMQEEARKRALAIERALGYDEDFEADLEKSVWKVNEEGQTGDQMKRMSKSPSDDEKDNLDHEKEDKKSSLKAPRASDSERDESDGYTGSDLEEEKKQGRKVARSLSSSSVPYSSENDSDRETRKRGGKREETDRHSGYESETAKTQREEGQGTDVEEEPDNIAARDVPVTSHKVRKARLQDTSPDSEEGKVVGSVHRSLRDDREKDVFEHSEHSHRAKSRSRGPSEDEDEGDGKSVKEKIAEAIDHDRLLSSEPEPSESSTEDEEESIAKKDKHKEDKHKVPDGASLAKESRVFESQKVAGQVEHVRQMVGKERALDEEELADEEGPEEAALGEELRGKDVKALKTKENKLLKGSVKDKIYVKIQREDGSFVEEEEEDMAPGSKLDGVVSSDHEKAAVSGALVYGGKGVRQGVSSEMEEIVQDISGLRGDETKKTYLEVKEKKRMSRDKGSAQQKLERRVGEPLSETEAEGVISGEESSAVKRSSERRAGRKTEVREKKRISRDGVSAQEELEPWEGEPLSEIEAEGVISGAEDEDTTAQQARIIRKAERSAVKQSSERRTGRKTEMREKKRISRDEGAAQEELEPWEGEPLSESEAEGVISGVEDEDITAQEARAIRKAERSAVKRSSERRAGRKTEMREKKRISRDGVSAQEELEPWEGETLSETEAEGVISGAEDEDTTPQQARVIRKAERSAVKRSSERRAGRKTEVREKKRISRDGVSAQEELEPWEGEPLSESEAEAEGVISGAEDEDTTAQEARVIQKAERSAVKRSSERRAGRKTEMREKKRISRDEVSAQEELEPWEDEPLSEAEAEGVISGAEDEDTTTHQARVIRKAERSAVKRSSDRRDGRKTEMREKKRISRDEVSAQEELEPWEGEPLSESEAEGVISGAEDEDTTAQQARVIRKAERSAVKRSSERRAGRKTEMREKKRISRDGVSAQEELEPWEGEPLSEIEAEGVISGAEDEDTTPQQGRIIRKAERSAVKRSSERRAGRKTEMREKKRISRDEVSAQEELEPWEGEPLSESEAEAEGVISGAEDEDTTAQQARVIRKAERSAVKRSSERRAGRKTEMREKKRISRDEVSAQEELEPWEGEPLSESEAEAEGVISGAEDEDTTAQQPRVIRKAERSAVKRSSERRAGRKTEMREKKRISRDGVSAQEELEPWEGEPLSEIEAEGVISGAEDEDTTAQQPRVIRKAERSAVKRSSERRAGRKTEMREKKRISRDEVSAQEELEPWEGEALSESEAEAEGVISGAEDEDTTAQQARVIRKAERSAVKRSSERRAGRKTEMREKKRISRDEVSAQEELEPWEGEPLSEIEAEGVISGAEDEDTTPQQPRIIRKAERSAVKRSSERRAGRKTEMREKKRISRDEVSAQEELEPWDGEPLSEIEAEGVISGAEDEDTTAQQPRVIRKAERSAVQRSSERRAGRKTEMREKKRISRDEVSAQEELEPWEGEPLSEIEAEGVISGAEDEDTTPQQGRIIRKAERSAVKRSSERRAGRKTEMREKKRISRDEVSAQEELEPWEGEPLSEIEAEGVISGAEDEDTTAQQPRVIRKAERSAVKRSSERRAGRKTEMREKKRISRDGVSAQVELEPWEGEPLSEIEAEGVISGAEDEDTTPQQGRIIRKAERSAVKRSSERRAGRKTEMRVKKRISRDEVSAQEELEPWEGEPLSEIEAEGVISGAEDEDTTPQQARIIRKAERSAVKRSSERRAGRKTHLEVREKKKISRDKGSAGQKLESEVGEPLLDTETEGVISGAEDEDMTAQQARVIRKAERSGVKPRSERRAGRRATVKGVVASAEGAVEEGDLIEEEGEEVEEGGREVRPGSGVAAPKQKQRGGRRKTEAEGEVDFEEAKAGRKVAIRRTEAEVSGKERERGSRSMAHEKEIAHGMAITAIPRVAGVTEATHLSEPFTQKAALTEGRMGSHVTFQDEVEKTPKETVAGKMSPDLGVQIEDASEEVEKEEEAYPTITLRDVEEALLVGMQKLIEQVSLMNVEQVEEEPEVLEGDVSVEEARMLSHKEEAGRKEVFGAVVKRKTWGAQSDNAKEAGTEEPVEEKYRNEQGRTGEEESLEVNLPVKETVPSNAQQPERELPANFTLQMISLESSRTFRTSD
ncbi:glutamate-rich protein 3 isoform X2 [Zootoca vivipara]|uniref:glutamate-rich protein 3 isoform X2 n=1 Tax=Zootoca vivipara TaxID=8524 RepID=UPI00293BBAA0|nr:glutamate-rich protein 3 isoform X2 [Zootoca vivipara]